MPAPNIHSMVYDSVNRRVFYATATHIHHIPFDTVALSLPAKNSFPTLPLALAESEWAKLGSVRVAPPPFAPFGLICSADGTELIWSCQRNRSVYSTSIHADKKSAAAQTQLLLTFPNTTRNDYVAPEYLCFDNSTASDGGGGGGGGSEGEQQIIFVTTTTNQIYRCDLVSGSRVAINYDHPSKSAFRFGSIDSTPASILLMSCTRTQSCYAIDITSGRCVVITGLGITGTGRDERDAGVNGFGHGIPRPQVIRSDQQNGDVYVMDNGGAIFRWSLPLQLWDTGAADLLRTRNKSIASAQHDSSEALCFVHDS